MMLKKQWFYPLLATWFLSGVSFANDQQTSHLDHNPFYMGIDWLPANQATLDSGGISISESGDIGDMGYNLVAGYELNTHRVVKVGLEAEYRQFGDVSVFDTLTLEGQGVFLNVKPKFIIEYEQVDVYVALLAGLGRLDVKAKIPSIGFSESTTETAYQFGAELGFRLTSHWDVHLGYRAAKLSDDQFDIQFDGGYVGARYAF